MVEPGADWGEGSAMGWEVEERVEKRRELEVVIADASFLDGMKYLCAVWNQ